jgi:hypothetical protein
MIWSIFATVLSGVLVFVLGQIVVRFVIDPIKEVKEVLGEIEFAMIYHAPAILTPVGDHKGEDEAAKAIRELASMLRAKVEVIPLYACWSFLSMRFLPQRENLMNASSHLIGMANSVKKPDRCERNDGRRNKIKQMLGFDLME